MSVDPPVAPANPQPSAHFRAERLLDSPIIHARLPGLEEARGDNINGPSLIRVPEWVEGSLGAYYLYFAHHGGHYIRMAYADALVGPWTVLPDPGVLHMDNGPGIKHIASPDVHIDDEAHQLRMYFHQPVEGRGQRSFVATSTDGLQWDVRDDDLGLFYFRVFRHPTDGAYYAYSKDTVVGGQWARSKDGLSALRGWSRDPARLPPRCHLDRRHDAAPVLLVGRRHAGADSRQRG